MRSQLGRVAAAGGRMLAGGIIGYPRHIGRDDTGDPVRWRARPRSRSTGPRWRIWPAGSATWAKIRRCRTPAYVSAFGFYYAALAGFLESAALAREPRRGAEPTSPPSCPA